MKKLISFITVLAILLSALVIGSDVRAEEDYYVRKIEITFDEPKEGDDIAAFISKKGNAKIPAGVHYSISSVEVETGEWPNTVKHTTGKFEKTDYMIRFNIDFEAGYRNSTDIMNSGLIINGYSASTSRYASGNILTCVGYGFSFGKAVINKVNFVVPEPVIGKEPAKNMIIESDPADAVTGNVIIKWFKSTQDISLNDVPKALDDGILTEMADGEICEKGMYYYALFPDQGSDFSFDQDKYQPRLKVGQPYVNGKIYDGPGFCYVVKYGPLNNKFNVSFETGEGSKVEPQIIAEGEKAVKPADPTRSGYTFAGWYTSSDYKTAYDFGKGVYSDTVLYAKWEVKKEETKYKNEWVDGKWYDELGNCTYAGTLSWKQNATGWWVEDSEGWYPVSSWQKIDGRWYYFCADGYMDYSEYRDGCWLGADGAWDERYSGGHWASDATGWWYADASGWYPKNQWVWIDGACYYFESTGYMATNKYVDGCWVGSDGAWVK